MNEEDLPPVMVKQLTSDQPDLQPPNRREHWPHGNTAIGKGRHSCLPCRQADKHCRQIQTTPVRKNTRKERMSRKRNRKARSQSPKAASVHQPSPLHSPRGDSDGDEVPR